MRATASLGCSLYRPFRRRMARPARRSPRRSPPVRGRSQRRPPSPAFQPWRACGSGAAVAPASSRTGRGRLHAPAVDVLVKGVMHRAHGRHGAGVDHISGAGCGRDAIGGKEGDEVGDFLRLRRPADRDAGERVHDDPPAAIITSAASFASRTDASVSIQPGEMRTRMDPPNLIPPVERPPPRG